MKLPIIFLLVWLVLYFIIYNNKINQSSDFKKFINNLKDLQNKEVR